ncbi:glycerophosphodiester phosphodiesterase family protein [Pseudomarimonas arenosa]|uniref:glycerophosphodiester phosphodiesterase n=1 Tax=Pseudomarimonas arenosa TaxID=2774145 RepID=A0AAW3ZPH0_9GAMM|nr:glycerophosphodiester phosphodiesterase family protein [Pseudomarimonas arenosa]MBD8528078.1 hypothetical protein [Pseudomarimonas arenosa]
MSGWSTLDGRPTQIIAHRGNSGEYPEHVLPGYQSALALGADIIEPDLLASADGVLFCRHDLGLRRSTTIGELKEFAGRQTDGDFCMLDFEAAEVDRLRAVQPFPARNAALNGLYPPPRFSAVIEWAAQQGVLRGRPVLLYPELKHPAEHRQRGIDAPALLIEHCLSLPLGVELLLQCFCVDTLRELKQATGLPVALLLDSNQDPQLALTEHGAWLDGLALSKKLLLGENARCRVDAIHSAGLRVDVWTLRDDQPGEGFANVEQELRHFFALGVDRLFADFPATALRVRDELAVG